MVCCISRRRVEAGNGCALRGIRQRDRDNFHRGRARTALARGLAARINQNEPWPLRALQRGFHALAIIPAIDGHFIAADADAGHMRVGASAEALRDAGQHAVPPRSCRGDNQRGLGCLANRFRRRRIGGVAGLAEVLADHAKIFRGGAGSDGVRRRLNAFADQTHDEF